jgi:hypothetical protein
LEYFILNYQVIPNANGKAENLREGIWLSIKLEKPTVSKRDTKGFFKRRWGVIIPRSKIHLSIWIGYHKCKWKSGEFERGNLAQHQA